MGNGFQFIDIIFFAMIAAFLVLRLRSVLGRRDGTDGSHRDPFRRQENLDKADDNVIKLPDRADEEPAFEEPSAAPTGPADPRETLMAGLTQIKVADPSFEPGEFASGARIAFEMILNAYASGDTATLKSLLSNEVYADFERAIRDRDQAGEVLEDALVGIREAEIVEADMDGHMANVTMKFVSEQVNVTRDENGDVVDGNPNLVIDVTDYWTFARDTHSSDPNWTLVATSSLD